MNILIGMSGCGKSTIEEELIKKGYTRSVSYTTRAKRPGEVDGVNYHFIDKLEFERKYAAGEIVERSKYNGHLYGIGKEDLHDNIVCSLNLDGLRALKKLDVDITSFYITVPDKIRIDRLVERGANREFLESRIPCDEAHFAGAEELVDYIVENDELMKVVNYIDQKIQERNS